MNDAIGPEAILRLAGATEERFAPRGALPAASPEAMTRGIPFGRLRLMTIDDAAAAPARSYLIGGLLGEGDLSLWWGQPKTGKSFLLIRLAFGLALGRRMWGRTAKQSNVIYIAAEGEGGVHARMLALRDELGDPAGAFRYIAGRVEVGPPGVDLDAVIAAAQHAQAGLVVLDTLARTFGDGDENSARDMGGFISAADRIRAEVGAHVAIVHHGRKDGESGRGSGALQGAVDLIVKVTRGADGSPNTATIEAAKDDADGAVMPFRLRLVEAGRLADGTARMTCVAEEGETIGRGARKAPIGRFATALNFLRDIMAAGAEPLPAEWRMPDDLRAVLLAHWETECIARHLVASDDPKNRKTVFNKVVADLRAAGHVALRDGMVWVP